MQTRTWFRIHSFTGVITGLLLFVVCWSGTVATLAHELDWLVTPAARTAEAHEVVDWDAVLAGVRSRYPEAQVSWLVAPRYSHSAVEAVVEPAGGPWRRLYVNPVNGVVQGESSYLTVQRFFRSFHRRLFLPNPWGVYLVALFSVTLMVSVIAALNFYKRWWRRFFSFRASSGRRLWSELHKTGGLWGLWFALLMGVTGIWYGLEATRLPQKLFATETERPDPPAVESPKSLGRLVDAAQQVRPGLTIKRLYPPGSFYGEGLVAMGQADDWLVRDRVNYAAIAADGEVVATQSGSDLTAYEYWVNMADPLHFGDFGGLVSKAIWFVFGLVLCGLVLTGTWLHAYRLAMSAGGRARHRWPGTLAAILVSLLVLALSVPYGFMEAQSYAVHGGFFGLPDVKPGVAAVILGWIVLTLVLLGAWVVLLWRPHLMQRKGPTAN